MKHLLLFDFDGTLTEKDTLFEIAKFSTTTTTFLLNFIPLIPTLALMKVGLLSKQKGKEAFLRRYFGRYTEESFVALCDKFVTDKLPSLLRPFGMDHLKNQLKNGREIVVVSASPENWIKPWADQYQIEVISTKLKFENNRLSGIDGLNCNGKEKVRRIKEEINLSDYDKVIAYGDTKGDLPMLALAHEKHYKPFR